MSAVTSVEGPIFRVAADVCRGQLSSTFSYLEIFSSSQRFFFVFASFTSEKRAAVKLEILGKDVFRFLLCIHISLHIRIVCDFFLSSWRPRYSGSAI